MDLNQISHDESNSNQLFEAQAHIYKHVLNHATSMSLGCALELHIPNIVHNHGKPITIQELVANLNLPLAKTLHLQRLMRFLVHTNFFSIAKLEDRKGDAKNEGYVLTSSSRLLLKNTSENSQDSDSPSLLAFASMSLDPVVMVPWRFLAKWFLGSESTVFETAHGIPLWEFANKDSRFNRIFNDAMKGDSEMMSLVVKDCREVFEGVKTLVDVGGGTGLTANILVEAFPDMTCTVFDLPHVVSDMVGTRNLKYVGGDMFSYIPYGDVILFKNVLHNWSDDNVLKILKRCREVIRNEDDKGKVIIIDMVLDEKHDRHEITETKIVFDILMMVLVAGRERSMVEWKKLFLEAGFGRYKITPNFAGLKSLIEVFP